MNNDEQQRMAMLSLIQAMAAQFGLLRDLSADLKTLKQFVYDTNPDQAAVLNEAFDRGRKDTDEGIRKILLLLEGLAKQFSPKVH